jgi:hypothetical protein
MLFASQASAQPTISLSIDRIGPGYNLGSDMMGDFEVTAHVSSDVVHVDFYLNGTLQRTVSAAPFSWNSNTNDYPLGHYEIKAVAYDLSGDQANAILNQNFVDSTNGNITLIAVVLISIIAIGIFAWLHFKGGNFVKCPKCDHVFRHTGFGIGIHLSTALFNKCPNCGKIFWGHKTKKPTKSEEKRSEFSSKEEDRLRKDIDESKYETE